jgi:signal transduction histidine kinase
MSTGFLLFAPYYDQSLPQTTSDERLQALRGYTIAMFRGDIFFQRIFKDVDLSHVKVGIYLGDAVQKNLLYEGGVSNGHDTRVVTQKIDYYGRTLTLVYTFDTAYILSWWLTNFPQILIVIGLFIGMLFAGISGYLLRSRYKRLTYEKERDVNFAKDELLSLASHQLRTPATGVKQYLGMVLQGFAGDVTDLQRTYLERAYASNDRQLHIINDILHLAKLEAGRIVLAEHEFSIADMVKEIIDEQMESVEKADLTLTYKGPTRGLMKGDSHMLRMVVENLVTNAIKYTPPGGKVTVRLSRLGSYWIIVVKDTGVGIAKSDYSKLFKQFTRIENDRSAAVTGTGIGLYLAYHLTLLHGGTIGVSSSKTKGTTFTLRLPRKM